MVLSQVTIKEQVIIYDLCSQSTFELQKIEEKTWKAHDILQECNQ